MSKTCVHPTKISWCTHSWNPIIGCHRGCPYCYAWRENGGITRRWAKQWVKPWNRSAEAAQKAIDDFLSFAPQFIPERMGHRHPQKNAVIFVCSMSDPEYWPPEWMEAILHEIDQHPDNTYIMLSKSPHYLNGHMILPENLRPGITITSLEGTDRDGDVDLFLQAFSGMGAVLNVEPLLGRVTAYHLQALLYHEPRTVIVGAETGARDGKVVPEKAWVDEIVQTVTQCNATRDDNINLHLKPSIIELWSEYDRPEFKELIR